MSTKKPTQSLSSITSQYASSDEDETDTEKIPVVVDYNSLEMLERKYRPYLHQCQTLRDPTPSAHGGFLPTRFRRYCVEIDHTEALCPSVHKKRPTHICLLCPIGESMFFKFTTSNNIRTHIETAHGICEDEWHTVSQTEQYAALTPMCVRVVKDARAAEEGVYKYMRLVCHDEANCPTGSMCKEVRKCGFYLCNRCPTIYDGPVSKYRTREEVEEHMRCHTRIAKTTKRPYRRVANDGNKVETPKTVAKDAGVRVTAKKKDRKEKHELKKALKAFAKEHSIDYKQLRNAAKKDRINT